MDCCKSMANLQQSHSLKGRSPWSQHPALWSKDNLQNKVCGINPLKKFLSLIKVIWKELLEKKSHFLKKLFKNEWKSHKKRLSTFVFSSLTSSFVCMYIKLRVVHVFNASEVERHLCITAFFVPSPRALPPHRLGWGPWKTWAVCDQWQHCPGMHWVICISQIPMLQKSLGSGQENRPGKSSTFASGSSSSSRGRALKSLSELLDVPGQHWAAARPHFQASKQLQVSLTQALLQEGTQAGAHFKHRTGPV